MNKTEQLRRLKKAGFMTGSVKFGCDNPKDEDWIISYKNWTKITDNIFTHVYYNSQNYTEDDEFQSFFMDHEGTKYNFLVMWKGFDVKVWRRATKLMMRIPTVLIQDKSVRVEYFESLKDLVRHYLLKKYPQKPKPITDDDIPY